MTARMGAVYGPKGPACALRFENLNHQEAYAKYEMLGLLTVYDVESSDITPAIKKDVEREGCKIGGDAVTLNASVPGWCNSASGGRSEPRPRRRARERARGMRRPLGVEGRRPDVCPAGSDGLARSA